MPDDELLVSVEVTFEDAESFSGATVYVRLEDVSRADLAARVIAEQVLRDVSLRPDRPAKLMISLRSKAVDEHARYAVRVHADLDGDGQISRGDYISMESYPVLTFGNPHETIVRVRKVT